MTSHHSSISSKNATYFECEECVWGGDFNLVSDGQKDKQVGRPVTHEKSREKVKCKFYGLNRHMAHA